MSKSIFFKQTNKKTNLVIPLIISFILVGIGAIAIANYWSKKERTLASIASQTIPVKSQELTVQIQANGTVQAIRTNNLSPDEPGTIAQLVIEEGDRVTQGQVIARMESDRLQAQVNQYQAMLQKAQANLAQVKAGNRPEAIAALRS
ncbi:MAG: hypothetical protein RLZZ574_578 [Cyanobacteriota bacterium]|jgi:HlyD family secretion protein